MILLDTHVLIWLTQQPEKIGSQAKIFIENNWQTKTIAVSSISFWECQMLSNKGRISLPYSVTEWRNKTDKCRARIKQ